MPSLTLELLIELLSLVDRLCFNCRLPFRVCLVLVLFCYCSCCEVICVGVLLQGGVGLNCVGV